VAPICTNHGIVVFFYRFTHGRMDYELCLAGCAHIFDIAVACMQGMSKTANLDGRCTTLCSSAKKSIQQYST